MPKDTYYLPVQSSQHQYQISTQGHNSHCHYSPSEQMEGGYTQII